MMMMMMGYCEASRSPDLIGSEYYYLLLLRCCLYHVSCRSSDDALNTAAISVCVRYIGDVMCEPCAVYGSAGQSD